MKKRYKANMKNVKVYSEIAACKMCVALWERIGEMVSDKYSNHDISLLFKKQIDVIKERACYDVDGQRESLEVGITFEEWSVLEGMHQELSE